MSYWSWWMGGSALAAVTVGHLLLTGRALAVSGRVTALVNGWRSEKPAKNVAMTQEELLEAIASATAAEFGESSRSIEPPTMIEPTRENRALRLPSTIHPSSHIAFLLSLALGGAISHALGDGWQPVMGLRSVNLSVFLNGLGLGPVLLLLVGGFLVGFGTRMAGGCTSGHGLSGVSRFQPGSLLATVAFFGAGLATAIVLESLS